MGLIDSLGSIIIGIIVLIIIVAIIVFLIKIIGMKTAAYGVIHS